MHRCYPFTPRHGDDAPVFGSTYLAPIVSSLIVADGTQTISSTASASAWGSADSGFVSGIAIGANSPRDGFLLVTLAWTHGRQSRRFR